MYKILDLFAGIGGFSLGLERAGMETVAFCEIEPFAQKVLKKHWPNVPIYNDIEELNYERLKADGIQSIQVVTGGFPCQDLSNAGKKAGITGSRSGLWSEMWRIISEIRPRYALIENVSALLAGPAEQPGQWFSRVLSDLAKIGYDAEWHCIPASHIGAPHQRDRVFVMAYPTSIGLSQSSKRLQFTQKFEGDPGTWNGERMGEPRIERVADGVPKRMDGRLKACGNAIVPQIAEMIGRSILEREKTKKPPGRSCTDG